MSSPILETKLFIPQGRPNLVARQRLFERLNAGLQGKLTVVSAPPGFGKTTLVSDWLASSDRPVAWLSLDASDNDFTHFLTYLVAAIQKISGDLGGELLPILHANPPAPPSSLSIALLNSLMGLPSSSILVLDDYHLIQSLDVREAMGFLLEHLPPTLHLIITTRHEPDLPLARLRARGQLSEIRAADLRFSLSESADFLNQSMALSLSEDAIQTLEMRTEGWIAGLQLAALSLQNQPGDNPKSEIFSGRHHFVADYLVEEVLRAQSESTRDFLLRTAPLERLSGALCDALTGRSDGRKMLHTLERGNLFLIPLDESRTWYRYHHLFAEVLRSQLKSRSVDDTAKIHLQASEWFEQEAFAAEAIYHARLAHQPERIAALVETHWPELREIYNDDSLIRWVKDLPEPLFQARPLLNLHYAFAMMSVDPASASKRLDDIDSWLNSEARTPEELDRAQLHSLPGMAAIARAYQAGALGDLPKTVKYTEKALRLLPADDFFGRGSAGAMLGLTYWAQGNLPSGYQAIEQSLHNMRHSENISGTISIMFIQADMCLAQLKLREAEKICREAMALTAGSDVENHQGSADIQVILSEIHYERGELEHAKAALQTSLSFGEHAGLEVMRHRWYVAMAYINLAEGDIENALGNLEEAEAVYLGSPAPEIRPIDAIRARFWVRENRLLEAESWLASRGTVVEENINHIDLYPMATYALCLLSSGKEPTTLDSLLNDLVISAEANQRTADLIDILILKTLHHQKTEPLEQALSLAAVEGAVQRFLDAGTPLLPFLEQIKTGNQQVSSFAAKIFDALSTQTNQPAKTSPEPLPLQLLVEPLSEREIEVLGLMAEGKTNQQIADQLYLTLNTIKVHSRNIYSKLDVHNRTQAVNHARTLGLLSF